MCNTPTLFNGMGKDSFQSYIGHNLGMPLVTEVIEFHKILNGGLPIDISNPHDKLSSRDTVVVFGPLFASLTNVDSKGMLLPFYYEHPPGPADEADAIVMLMKQGDAEVHPSFNTFVEQVRS